MNWRPLEPARTAWNSYPLPQLKTIDPKAKVSGLLVQRVEVGPAGPFDECESYAELAGKMLGTECEARFHPVTDDDREALTELIERQAGELG